MTEYLNKSNRARSTLRQPIDDTATTLYVESGTGSRFPSSNFNITIEDERILVGSRTGDTFSSLTRGYDGTVANSHDFGENVNHNVIAEWFDELETNKLDRDGSQSLDSLLLTSATEKTISSGAITVDQTLHTVDTEGDASTDDLATINRSSSESVCIISPANDARTVVVKHNTGNIVTFTGSDLTLDSTDKAVLLVYDSTNSVWKAIGGGEGGGITGLDYDSGNDEVDLTKTLNANDNPITNLLTGTFNLEYDNGTLSTNSTIDFTNGQKQVVTLGGDITLTLSSPAGPANVILRLVQDATGSRTPTWAASSGSIYWAGGSEPSWSTSAGAEDVISLYWNGSNWYAQAGIGFA